MKKYLWLVAVLFAVAIPAATQDDDQAAFNAKFRSDGIANCAWWNLNRGLDNDSWALGYLIGFTDGTSWGAKLAAMLAKGSSGEVGAVEKLSGQAYIIAVPQKLTFEEIKGRVDYACSQPSSAQTTLGTVLSKIATDMNR